MDNSRRAVMKGLCALPALGLPLEASSVFNAAEARSTAPALPDKASFAIQGVYLDAAYTHPLSVAARRAYEQFLDQRAGKGKRIGPGNNPRDAAVGLFARLINADPHDLAVVPSTMEGENLVGAALGLNATTGVVTDVLHYDASLVMYGELAKRGVPVTVVPAKDGAVLLRDMEAAIAQKPRLVAVSLISNVSGFQHDLKALCEIAHSKGALVYADIIQAAGAVPVDVKATGVDFCGCGTYKWLMGDFGTAFLYVRPDRLGELHRVEVGWRQIRQQDEDTFPYPPAAGGAPAWKLGSDAAGIFEVSTPAWGALACVARSLGYLDSIGVEAIANHRQPLIEVLCRELPKHGFRLLTPRESAGPIVVFAYKGAATRFAKPLRDAGIQISTYENRIRISPSVYNDMNDIEQLLQVLSARS